MLHIDRSLALCSVTRSGLCVKVQTKKKLEYTMLCALNCQREHEAHACTP